MVVFSQMLGFLSEESALQLATALHQLQVQRLVLVPRLLGTDARLLGIRQVFANARLLLLQLVEALSQGIERGHDLFFVIDSSVIVKREIDQRREFSTPRKIAPSVCGSIVREPGNSKCTRCARLYRMQNPVQSNQSTFRRFLRLLMKANSAPLWGSSPRCSRAASASPSNERRISCGSEHTKIRVAAGITPVP